MSSLKWSVTYTDSFPPFMGQNLASDPSLQWVLGSALPNPHAMYPAVRRRKGPLTKGGREDSEVRFSAYASCSLGHFLHLRILLLSSDT